MDKVSEIIMMQHEAQIAFSEKNYTKSIEIYNQALHADPGNVSLWAQRARAKLDSGNTFYALGDAVIATLFDEDNRDVKY